nr:hypothetical protein [Tanacetum cinerariifolium]
MTDGRIRQYSVKKIDGFIDRRRPVGNPSLITDGLSTDYKWTKIRWPLASFVECFLVVCRMQVDLLQPCPHQTKKVEDLARLSLQNTPVYIDVDFGSFRIQARGISPLLEGKDVLGATRIVTTNAQEQNDLLLWLQRYVANIGLSTIHKEECCEAALRKYIKHGISVVKLHKTPNSDNRKHEICVVKLL